jgi:1-acyl-sn-glycerol-3-phosphate acyltransferase
VRTLFRVFLGFKEIGTDKVPPKGPVIIASNHRSYFDPPLLGVSIQREIHFLAKSELFTFKPFAKLITTLNAHPVRRGRKDTVAVNEMIGLLEKGEAVVIFPEGTRRTEKRRSVKIKSGVARLAQATGAPILTVHIKGSREKWKAFLRIKPVCVKFGRIIGPEEYRDFGENPKGFRELACYILEEIDKLGGEGDVIIKNTH